jgi:hypothetical protein
MMYLPKDGGGTVRFGGFCSILLLTLLNHHVAFAGPVPRADTCVFYLDMEKDIGCWLRESDQSDYLVQYGYKYCGIFKSKSAKWNDERAEWVKQTTLCLQKSMTAKTQLNCLKIEDEAFSSHPGCYRASGFCQLSKWQKTTIVWAAAGIDVLLAPKQSSYQAVLLLKDCLEPVAVDVLNALRARAKYLAGTGSFVASQLFEIFAIDRVSEGDLEKYGRSALRKLLGADRGATAGAVKAFAELYATDNVAMLSYGQIENDCLQRQNPNSQTCQAARAALKSSKEFADLKGVPTKVDSKVISEILAYRDQLQKEKSKTSSK